MSLTAHVAFCSTKWTIYLVGFSVDYRAFLPSRTNICFSSVYSQFHENTPPSFWLMCSIRVPSMKPVVWGMLLFGTWSYWTFHFSNFKAKGWCLILAAFPMTLGIKMNIKVLPFQLLHLLHYFLSQPDIVILKGRHAYLCYCSQLSHSQQQSEEPEEPQQKGPICHTLSIKQPLKWTLNKMSD